MPPSRFPRCGPVWPWIGAATLGLGACQGLPPDLAPAPGSRWLQPVASLPDTVRFSASVRGGPAQLGSELSAHLRPPDAASAGAARDSRYRLVVASPVWPTLSLTLQLTLQLTLRFRDDATPLPPAEAQRARVA